MKILVKFPTRSRPAKFMQVLEQYIMLANDTATITFLITYDDDDLTMNNSAVLDKLKALSNIIVKGGTSKNKIDAINRDMDKAPAWDICILASDDMICQKQGWDDDIRAAFEQSFPDTDGTLWFHDGDPATLKGELCTMCILGKKYYDRFGYIYHPDYTSLWCDNEYTKVAQELQRMKYFPEVLFRHVHFSNTPNLKPDALMQKTQSYFEKDKAVFTARQLRGFDLKKQHIMIIESPAPVLSILIPTVVGREANFDILKNKIKAQAAAANLILGLDVEILSAKDDKQISIGKKRQFLYQKAKGAFSVQLDDDDDIVDDYVKTVHAAAKHAVKIGADCIGYQELCSTSQNKIQKISNFSLKYPAWKEFQYAEESGFHHYRTPFCKTPILTKLCVQAGVADMRFGEDHDFAKRIYPLLNKEVYINKVMYLYNYTPEDHNKKYGIKKQPV
jgi:hypothetical protein